ncbi:TetR/AcrR family transcriptional regulator [Methylotenera versatilis]|uniref:Transcriptional regulator, TetR family n=1 Tax=Methylotenera versatilis (strain 301) TaxID=666681 RepID=D7DPH9_METV0|nr:TetR/AcrR family transcriptional regulator [Methylotenera versatilis]ADI29223.1 transcriptional regulator, TetR family [Methylotenera versatilis 301]
MNTENNNLDVRQHTLETAQKIISRKGYSAVGLNEILTAADVPKGSFYYYFKSKDAFGEAMLQNYFEEYLATMDTIFSAENQTMAQRLLNYWEHWLTSQETFDCQGKCLAVKLAAEVSDLSEAMRLALKSGTLGIISRLAGVIDGGMADGSLNIEADANSLAQTLYQMWLGASLMAKITRSIDPMNNAMAATRKILHL